MFFGAVANTATDTLFTANNAGGPITVDVDVSMWTANTASSARCEIRDGPNGQLAAVIVCPRAGNISGLGSGTIPAGVDARRRVHITRSLHVTVEGTPGRCAVSWRQHAGE